MPARSCRLIRRFVLEPVRSPVRRSPRLSKVFFAGRRSWQAQRDPGKERIVVDSSRQITTMGGPSPAWGAWTLRRLFTASGQEHRRDTFSHGVTRPISKRKICNGIPILFRRNRRAWCRSGLDRYRSGPAGKGFPTPPDRREPAGRLLFVAGPVPFAETGQRILPRPGLQRGG